jgi:hypothetical protein
MRFLRFAAPFTQVGTANPFDQRDFESRGCRFKSCRDRQLARVQGPGRSMSARGPAAMGVASWSGPDQECQGTDDLQQMNDEVRAPRSCPWAGGS